MATGQYTLEDVGPDGAGCAHDYSRRTAVLDAVHTFFTSPPANTSQTVVAQLRAAIAVPLGRTPTVAETERALYSLLEERR